MNSATQIPSDARKCIVKEIRPSQRLTSETEMSWLGVSKW